MKELERGKIFRSRSFVLFVPACPSDADRSFVVKCFYSPVRRTSPACSIPGNSLRTALITNSTNAANVTNTPHCTTDRLYLGPSFVGFVLFVKFVIPLRVPLAALTQERIDSKSDCR